MSNEITLDEPLTFSRYEGQTGREMLQTKDGLGFLRWAYSSSDIPMDVRIVNEMIANGAVKPKASRQNSLDQTKRNQAAFEVFVTLRPVITNKQMGENVANILRSGCMAAKGPWNE